MNKDVIYIDIEDDITGIISKVKSASAKIVALVPPKRIGALQSAVNLKLLGRAASAADKRIVLITNDHALIALAAGVKIPVAKNLQSRPEVPQIAALEVDDEEVIHGDELPSDGVAASPLPAAEGGDAAPEPHKPPTPAEQQKMAIGNAVIDVAAPNVKPADLKLKAKQPKSKVPNFERFRKRLFLIGGGAAALTVFLVWATAVAPHATITISAKTTSVATDQALTLDPGLQASDPAAFKLKPTVKQLKKDVVATFTATGSKDIGNKATGTITVTNHDSSNPVTVPSGATFVGADGHTFVSAATMTVPGATISHGTIQDGTATGNVAATAIGPEYNITAQAYSVPGFDLAASGSAMTGGTRQTVTVVSQDDVDKAKTQLPQQDAANAQNELKAQFGADVQVINESFATQAGQPAASPDVGQQAQQGKVTLATTYSLVALSRSDIKAILTKQINDALKGQATQQMYSLGDNHVAFQSFQQLANGTYGSRMAASGAIGPKIDTKALAKQITGKRSGEVQQLIGGIAGVSTVKVDYSPFWVITAPAPDKIDINFSISNGG